MSKIDIFTIIGPNAVEFAEFAADTMIQTSSGHHELRFHCIQHNDHVLPQRHWVKCGTYESHIDESGNHSRLLNEIINHIPNDSDFIVIVDVDIAVLLKDWDDRFVNLLNIYDVLGTESGRHVGSGYHKKFNYFPNCWFFMCPTHIYKHVTPDWSSIPGGVFKVETELDSIIYGLPINEVYFTDTGWNVPKQFYNKQCFNFYSLTYNMDSRLLSDMQKLGYNRDYNQEWLYGNELCVTHYSQSSFANERDHAHDTPAWMEVIKNHVYR